MPETPPTDATDTLEAIAAACDECERASLANRSHIGTAIDFRDLGRRIRAVAARLTPEPVKPMTSRELLASLPEGATWKRGDLNGMDESKVFTAMGTGNHRGANGSVWKPDELEDDPRPVIVLSRPDAPPTGPGKPTSKCHKCGVVISGKGRLCWTCYYEVASPPEPPPVAVEAEKPPTWYTVDEIRDWLKREHYAPYIADKLAEKITAHWQLAFEKGWSMGVRRAPLPEKPTPPGDGEPKRSCTCGANDVIPHHRNCRHYVAPWANSCTIMDGPGDGFWVRFTGSDGIYRWLHPNGGWVEEPNQIGMQMFPARSVAWQVTCASINAPPTWQDSRPKINSTADLLADLKRCDPIILAELMQCEAERDKLAAENSFTIAKFSRANRTRSESPQGFNHSLDSWSLSDWFVAVMGELGEAANIAKKLNRVRDGIPGNKETEAELRAMLADELADADIYLDLLFQSQGIDRTAAIISKFNRTSAKIGYPVELLAARTP